MSDGRCTVCWHLIPYCVCDKGAGGMAVVPWQPTPPPHHGGRVLHAKRHLTLLEGGGETTTKELQPA